MASACCTCSTPKQPKRSLCRTCRRGSPPACAGTKTTVIWIQYHFCALNFRCVFARCADRQGRSLDVQRNWRTEHRQFLRAATDSLEELGWPRDQRISVQASGKIYG